MILGGFMHFESTKWFSCRSDGICNDNFLSLSFDPLKMKYIPNQPFTHTWVEIVAYSFKYIIRQNEG